jgi:integrase/recombinase XerC
VILLAQPQRNQASSRFSPDAAQTAPKPTPAQKWDEEAAEAWVNQLSRKRRRLQLDMLVDTFLDEANVSDLTRRAYKDALAVVQRYYRESLGRVPVVDDITKASAVALRNKLEAAGFQPSTVHHRLRTLKQFTKWLLVEGYVDADPLALVVLPPLPVKPVETLTAQEAKLALQCCTNERDRAIVALMLDTGLRREEVCDLQLSDLDLKAGTLTVVGKGRKTRVVGVGDSRSHLRRWLLARPDDAETDHLFLTLTSPHEAITIAAVSMLFRKLTERSGLKHLHPHLLRHTMATMLYNETNDVAAVQQILGHADLETTQRYLHRDPARSVAVHRKHSPLGSLLRTDTGRAGESVKPSSSSPSKPRR